MRKETIGERMKRFRKKWGMTQQEMALSLGYSDKSVISHIEKGDAELSYEKLMLFLRQYAVDANDLLGVEQIDRQIEEYKNRPRHETVAIYIPGHKETSNMDLSFLDEFDVKVLSYDAGVFDEIGAHIREQVENIIVNYQSAVIIAKDLGTFFARHYLAGFSFSQAFFISPVISTADYFSQAFKGTRKSSELLKDVGFVTLRDGFVLDSAFYDSILRQNDSWKVPTHILYALSDHRTSAQSIMDFLATHDASLEVDATAKKDFARKTDQRTIRKWIAKYIKTAPISRS